jgi:putative acetyltransferase
VTFVTQPTERHPYADRVPDVLIAVTDPRADDIRALLATHLAFAHEHTPAEHVHALDLDGLLAPDVTLYSARTGDGELLGIGALKEIDATHGELKSMHTVEAARRHGDTALVAPWSTT